MQKTQPRIDSNPKREALPVRQQRIFDFIASNPVGVLSTVTPDGDPHGVVVYFVVHADFTLSFLTRSETRKRDNIRFNDHVSLTIFEPVSQTTVQIVGTANVITEDYEVNAIAEQVFEASHTFTKVGPMPVTKLDAGSYVAFTITPVQIRMAVFGRPEHGEHENLFESIESFELEA